MYVYNGRSEGLGEKPSQVIRGQWAAGSIPASFGFALRGARDLDMNGYPGEGRSAGVLFQQQTLVSHSDGFSPQTSSLGPLA